MYKFRSNFSHPQAKHQIYIEERHTKTKTKEIERDTFRALARRSGVNLKLKNKNRNTQIGGGWVY